MKCPKCGEEVYDFYTTKERIAELYSVNTVAMWARNNLLILQEMLEEKKNSGLKIEWIAGEVKKIRDGLQPLRLIKLKEEK